MLTIDSEKHRFHLRGKNMSYIMQVEEDMQVHHLYWGDSVSELPDSWFDRAPYRRASLVEHKDADSPMCIREFAHYECPTYGLSDFRMPALQAEGEEAGTGAPDTLLLSAEDAEQNTWEINGTVLRRMNKSGIEHLAIRTGERLVVISTAGILKGWAYDELKSRGTGSRRFTFTIETGGGNPAVWQLDVEEKTYVLTEDTQADIHLTGVYDGPAEALDRPFGSWKDNQ